MTMKTISFLALRVAFLGFAMSLHAEDPADARVPVTRFGAVGDGETINTAAIQKTIDSLAANGGGTVEIPKGVFMSGALFLKPGVNLHLAKGAVLRCLTDMKHFPERRTRIEGHFAESFNPALINADGCDGLQITGEGTLDGNGRPIWDAFWKGIKADKNFRNIVFENPGASVFDISPWTQYFDLMGQPPPESTVKNITVSGVTGTLGSLGRITGHERAEIMDITLENVDVKSGNTEFQTSDKIRNLRIQNVRLNGKPYP
jgi:polygalacturonase